MNRETYPASLFPSRGDISAEAGASTTTVIGLQGTPVSATAPVDGQSLVAVSGVWTPASTGGWVQINGIPVSDDYEFGVNVAIAVSTQSFGVTINGV